MNSVEDLMVFEELRSSHLSSLMTFEKREFSNSLCHISDEMRHSPASGLMTLCILILAVLRGYQTPTKSKIYFVNLLLLDVL
jgi:hypothetical protein